MAHALNRSGAKPPKVRAGRAPSRSRSCRPLAAGLLIASTALTACGSSSSPASEPGGDGGDVATEAGADGFAGLAVDGAPGGDAGSEGGTTVPLDGSFPVGDASVSASRFVTSVVSFAPTDCAGFGAGSMPGVVEGPPVGGGTAHGSTDVVSLGSGGSIVVSFGPNAIVDGPGADFIVFENPFWIGNDSSDVYAEPGEVSVSDDGTTWQTFPCNPTFAAASDGTGTAPPYGSCAGWHVVYSSPTNSISPVDPTTAGGDAFDLATLGVTHARYVRIVDRTLEDCPESGADKPTSNGFDLDAVSIVNAAQP